MLKKKILSPKEKKKQEISQHLEKCNRPFSEREEFIKVSKYMLHHKRYLELSNFSKVTLLYMKDWATNSEAFWESGKFEYSYTMLENLGVMSRAQAIRCIKELREKGFIHAEYKNGAGAINRWSFSDRWYTGEKETPPEIDSYTSVKNTDNFIEYKRLKR